MYSDTIWIGAFRYYLGRRTYAVSDFCTELRANWNNLSELCHSLIQRELEQAFVEDAEDRSNYELVTRLGDDCDKAEWEKLRALWREVNEQ